MSQYPDISDARYKTISGGRQQKVLVGNVEDLGKEFRKRKWLYKKRTRSLNYPNISNEELRILLKFQDDQDLTYTSFVFIDDYPEEYTNEYIATSDGETLDYVIPCKDGSDIVVYQDGAELNQAPDSTSIGDYYIDYGAGVYGLDKIILNAALVEGTRITCDFTGQLAIRSRFSGEIQYQRVNVYLKLNSATVNLQGLLWS